ncbi:MAG: aminoacyl-tRNA hydrolase, partial [Acidobacteriota bacterium]
MYLIAGLGNPGRRYRKTRHNVGFMLVDRLAERSGLVFSSFRTASLIARGVLADRPVLLLKPQTFMNASGSSVREVIRYFDLPLERCLVVYDEVALPLGKIRYRRSGSAGGHRGMQSVIDQLGSQEIPRLRIGIAGEHPTDELVRYVLAKFARGEMDLLREVLEHCEESIGVFLGGGIEQAMDR